MKFDRDIDTRAIRHLRLHLQQMTHINIYGLVGLACCVLDATKNSRTINISLPSSPGAASFLSQLGFETFVRDIGYGVSEVKPMADATTGKVVLKLASVSNSHGLMPLEQLVWDGLDGVAGPKHRQAISEALWELGSNAIEHSHAHAVIAAAVQGRNRRYRHIDIAIGDIGIGIRESFIKGARPRHPATDDQALKLAVEDLVSSTADSGRGQGLYTTIEAVTSLGGQVTLRTGNARLIASLNRSDQGAEAIRRATSVPRLPGTIVAVRIPCR